jgi:thiosulfate reductase cytochrome b subunit
MKRINFRTLFLAVGFLLVVSALGLGIRQVMAGISEAPSPAASPLHPVFAMLDDHGTNVLESGKPVSTMKTCGQCHDTEFIVTHSFHSDLGLSEIQSSAIAKGETWDASSGAFGHWDPLTYRYLSQSGDERLDLGTPEWVMTYGLRHVGGGPATTALNDRALTSLRALLSSPETAILNPVTGVAAAWNWAQSGVIEMNCFLCHTPSPDTGARAAAITAGRFAWANTATLADSDLVTPGEGGTFTWNESAFDEDGLLLEEYVTIQDPTNGNCAACHGLLHSGGEPLALTGCSLDNSQTATTGQVISPDKISESGLNIADKSDLVRSWDIHAERQLQCVDCHYSLNNPIYYLENAATRPDNLIFDPRRIDFGAYLEQPSHNLARGLSAQNNLDPETEGSMRRCDSCHDAVSIHADWLPYTGTHMASVACESCHIPQMFAPAIESYDWTVITPAGEPAVVCRGVEGDPDSLSSLVTGFEPVLLPRTNLDESQSLAPYNLVTTWFWIYDDTAGNTRPVRLFDLEAAYLAEGSYAPEVLAAFDANNDGQLAPDELPLDTAEKVSFIAARLEALGLGNPRIQGLIQPYSISHGVAGAGFAVSDCRTCHAGDSQVTQAVQLAGFVPGGVMPEFAVDTNVATNGMLYTDGSGALYYQLDADAEDFYILGHSRVAWVDWTGGLFVLAVLAGISGHGFLRYLQARKLKKSRPEIRKVYMYEGYERFWHWLQTTLIVVLLLTGLLIHRPELFGVSFRGLVVIHNVSAAILAVNAALSLFYHLVSGKVRQFLPRPRGFFDDAIVQVRYYLLGIFKKEPHPFEKSADRKMNPLQQVTYLGILNVLLPLQGLTGILMWGVQRWPEVAAKFGGLDGLAPFHSLIAWVFAAFIIGHVYLTTTGGPQPLDSIKAMVTGWEDVEIREIHAEAMPPQEKKK